MDNNIFRLYYRKRGENVEINYKGVRVVLKRDLGERIRILCSEHGVSISELERDAGYSSGMISRWLAAGDEDFSVLTKLERISKRLNVSVDVLLGNTAVTSRRDNDSRQGVEIVSSLLTQMQSKKVQWTRVKFEDPYVGQLSEMKDEMQLSAVWSAQIKTDAETLGLYLAIYCCDILDESEPIKLTLNASIGHLFPLTELYVDEDELKTLFVHIKVLGMLQSE